MKKTLLIMFSSLVLFGCSKELTEAPIVTSIQLDKTDLTLQIGESYAFKVTYQTEKAQQPDYIWSTSDQSILSVTADGEIKALSVGDTKLIVRTTSRGIADTCNVIVSPIMVTTLTLSYPSTELEINQTMTISATCLPSKATYKKLLFESSDITVATVKDSIVTAKAAGKSTIRATTMDGSNITQSFNLVVKEVPPTIDADGNVYHTITIGTQTWMVENLKTTKYNDGTAIPNVIDNTEWTNLITPAYCWYSNDAATYKNSHGALYNWYTVNTAKLAPLGWHVPTDAEWTTLENFLIANGYNYDGTTTENKIAKSLSTTTGWSASTDIGDVGNDPSSNNSSGFSGFPGGCRFTDGTFNYFGTSERWWSSTQFDSNDAWNRNLYHFLSRVNRTNYNKQYGFSVRCLMDK